MTARDCLIRPLLLVAALAAAMMAGVRADAQVVSPSRFAPVDGQDETATLPNRLQGEVGITERLGERISLETRFVDERGRTVRIGDYVTGGRPVVLAFVYHSCPMLCSLILDGTADALRETDLALGQDFEMLAVSMDARDTPEAAAAARARYLERAGKPEAAEGWHFLTSPDEATIRQLADEVGFRFAFDPATEEFAHHAALIFLSPEGVVTRYLYGVQFPARDFRLATVEAGQGTVGSTMDRFLLTCFEFDPHAQAYSLAVLNVMKLGGGLLLLVMAGAFVFFWRRESRRRAEDWQAAVSPGT
ncbi:MAG: SCO family protein [Rubricoccaceae bacterium]